LKIDAHNAGRTGGFKAGFTLIELLTVIAIIGVLATLLSASLSSAQRKARKTASISNLRQTALAFTMYADDQRRRPASFREMVQEKYLTERALRCPEDKLGNWAGLIEATDFTRSSKQPPVGTVDKTPTAGDVEHSYFKSFDYSDEVWARIEESAMGGLAACQLHGIGRQPRDEPPVVDAFQGLVLRALKDGSVVQRQVFFGSEMNTAINMPSQGLTESATSPQLPLFLDPQP